MRIAHYSQLLSPLHRIVTALCLLLPAAAIAADMHCDIERPVVFAGQDYDSSAFHTAVARYIIEKGYGCKTRLQPGALIPLHNAMTKGDVDIIMEVWKSNEAPSWTKGLKDGKLIELGINFPDAIQGWFIPRYLVEGPNAPAPDLKSVTDLVRYNALFKDPEEPEKGRFLNCISGWQCETVNTKKLHAYRLNKYFTNFLPGSGAALAAAVESALNRKRPVLFYYWGPTWLLGKIGDQVVMLDEPAFDAEKWNTFNAIEDPEKAVDATAYPIVKVVIGANKDFADSAPAVRQFLTQYRTSSQLVSEALSYMQENDASAEDAAMDFLKNKQKIWKTWLPEEVAEQVIASMP